MGDEELLGVAAEAQEVSADDGGGKGAVGEGEVEKRRPAALVGHG